MFFWWLARSDRKSWWLTRAISNIQQRTKDVQKGVEDSGYHAVGAFICHWFSCEWYPFRYAVGYGYRGWEVVIFESHAITQLLSTSMECLQIRNWRGQVFKATPASSWFSFGFSGLWLVNHGYVPGKLILPSSIITIHKYWMHYSPVYIRYWWIVIT